MKWILLYGLLCLASSTSAQVLSAYKDGKWWIVNNDTFTQLPESFTHIGNFDAKTKTAEFITKSNYGIIDEKGNVVLPARFHSIESMGSGLYYCIDDSMGIILDIQTKKSLVTEVQKQHELNGAYSLVQFKDSLALIIHLESKLMYDFSDSSRVAGNYFNTLLIKETNSLSSIYDQQGNKVSLNDSLYSYNFGFITYKETDGETLITAKFNQKFTKIGGISVSGNFVSYNDGHLAYLYDSENRRIICSGKYDRITSAFFGGFLVEKSGKIGWMNEHGSVKIPIKYDAIYKFDENYAVRIGNLQGQYDQNFQLIVPVEFFDFYRRGEFIQTSSVLGYKGLYSLKSNKSFLKNIHSRIDINDGTIKAYYKNNIRIMTIDNNHRIRQDLILPNAITVRQELFSPFDADFSYDKRLLNLGWFYMENQRKDSLGNTMGSKYKWGLKNGTDSILIAPKLVMPIYMDRQMFSLIKTGKGEYKSVINTNQTDDFYGMRNHTTGRAFGNELILQMDSLDCMNRAYVRYETTKGYRVLLPNDSVKNVSYVSSSYNKHLPYCDGGKAKFCEETPISVPISHFSLNGKGFASLSYRSMGTGPLIDHQEIEGGKWNYLDSNGADLFPESFDFAQEFYLDRAIVLKGKSWGVISEDTVLIPFEYSEIARLKQFDDTVFIVKKDHNGKYLLNSSLDILENSGAVQKCDNNISIVKNGREQLIYRNDQLEKVHSSNTLILGYDSYAIREKKIYLIVDNEGKEIGQSEYKPKELLSEDLVLVSDKSNLGLSTLNGTIILEPGKYSFTRSGNYIHQISKSSTVVRNLEGKILLEFEPEYTVFQDPFSTDLMVERKGKIEQYNEQGVRVDKYKLTPGANTIAFAGMFFSRTQILSKDTVIVLGKEYSYELFSDGYFALIDAESHISVYNKSFENKVLEINARRIKEIGSGIFSYYSTEGIVLIREGFKKIVGLNAQIVSDFQDGFCLIQEGRDYYFLNEEFENQFNRKFLEAKPFQGEYASIKVKEGWTILDHHGKQKSYPSFNTIDQKGNGLFETNQKPTYGLFDNNGNEILPAIYEKIECITNEIIKVYKTGEIGYYSIFGEPIFELDVDRLSERK